MRGENFEVTEGDLESSVILHVPHSSRVIPSGIRSQILLDDAALEAELDEMTDSDTDVLAVAARKGTKIKPWIFRNTLSRLVIDPERFPDDREVMNQIGMGAVYLKSSSGRDLRENDPVRDSQLLERFFHPYALALEELVRSVLNRQGKVTIIDVHSYRIFEHTNGVNKGQRRPPVCLGVDNFHTPPWLIALASAAFGKLGEIVINEPFAGTYVPLSLYRRDARVTSVMMENREDNFHGIGITRAATVLSELISGIEAAR